jgi:ABC-2 type transport system ATP-binding protein
MGNMIEIRDLEKVYGKGPHSVHAVNGITFDVKEGEVFGFLGPNGAGKSTTISIITTLLLPTSGTVTVDGYDVVREATKVRHSIGLVPQFLTADDELSGRENMYLHADLYDVPKAVAEERIEELLKIMKLEDAADRRVDTYSGGMRKRLDLAQNLIHRPRILFLDEPTLGLDIQTREIIWDYIGKMRSESGMTVFLTTHYMEEADSLCDRIAIIDSGKIQIIGTPDELKASLGGDIIYAVIEGDRSEELRSISAVSAVEFDGVAYAIKTSDGKGAMTAILKKAAEEKWVMTSISLQKPDMNQVFLRYVRESLDEVVDKKAVRSAMGPGLRRH